MLIYIHGEDTFRSRQFLRKTIGDFKAKRDPRGFNTLIFDIGKEAPERVLGELLTLPFLAERRMLVLQNALSLSDKEFLEKLLGLVAENKIPEANVAVFWQSEPIGKTTEAKKLAELLAKEKFSYDFPKMTPAETAGWAAAEVKTRGGKIDRLAALWLAQNADDVWLLSSLLDQLVAYKKGEEIKTDDAKLFLEEKVDDNIFAMAEAIAIGDKKFAFKLLNEQRRMGEDESYLFAMILRQFKILLQMRDLWEREDGLTSEQFASRLGLHPFVVKKSLPLVRRHGLERLKEIYEELLEIDRRTKFGLAKQNVLIDFFIGKS